VESFISLRVSHIISPQCRCLLKLQELEGLSEQIFEVAKRLPKLKSMETLVLEES